MNVVEEGRLDGVPDDTPDIAYLGVEMTHGEGRSVRDAIDAIEGVGSSEARTEYGWLIERDGHGGLRYATPRSWTADHMKALRFARKVDAEEFAASHQDWSTDIRITEHAWD